MLKIEQWCEVLRCGVCVWPDVLFSRCQCEHIEINGGRHFDAHQMAPMCFRLQSQTA